PESPAVWAKMAVGRRTDKSSAFKTLCRTMVPSGGTYLRLRPEDQGRKFAIVVDAECGPATAPRESSSQTAGFSSVLSHDVWDARAPRLLLTATRVKDSSESAGPGEEYLGNARAIARATAIAFLSVLAALCPAAFALNPSLDMSQYAHT